MKVNTRNRKKAIKGFKQMYGRQEIIDRMYQIMANGKLGLDAVMLDIGRTVAEMIMYIEREERSGEDYHPVSPDMYKWASQGGSIYLVCIPLHSTPDYEVLKERLSLPVMRSSKGGGHFPRNCSTRY